MLIHKDGHYLVYSKYPNSNWLDDPDYFILDETTEEGIKMKSDYEENYPFVSFETEGDYVTVIHVLEKPEMPIPVEGKEIVLKKLESGEWVYVYVDLPPDRFTKLEKKVIEQDAIIEDLLFNIVPSLTGGEA